MGFSLLLIISVAPEEKNCQGRRVSCLCRAPPGVRDQRLRQDRKDEKGQVGNTMNLYCSSSDPREPHCRPLRGSWKYEAAYSDRILEKALGVFCWPLAPRC